MGDTSSSPSSAFRSGETPTHDAGLMMPLARDGLMLLGVGEGSAVLPRNIRLSGENEIHSPKRVSRSADSGGSSNSSSASRSGGPAGFWARLVSRRLWWPERKDRVQASLSIKTSASPRLGGHASHLRRRCRRQVLEIEGACRLPSGALLIARPPPKGCPDLRTGDTSFYRRSAGR